MSLVEQSMWWILPAFLIAGFMVFAMMEFTALLIARPRRGRKRPVPAAELRKCLLALNDPELPYRVVESERADLEVEWDVVDASWYELFAKVKLTSRYRGRMLMDEQRHQLRWYESVRTANWFIGFEGRKLRLNGSIQWHWGYIDVIWRGLAYGILPGFPPRIGKVYSFTLNTVALKTEIRRVVSRAGWGFLPAPHPLKVHRPWLDLTRALQPAWLEKVDDRWLWGSLYVGSFVLFYVYVFIAVADTEAGHYTLAGWWPALVVGGFWWVTWAALAWLLAGMPKLWKRRKVG